MFLSVVDMFLPSLSHGQNFIQTSAFALTFESTRFSEEKIQNSWHLSSKSSNDIDIVGCNFQADKMCVGTSCGSLTFSESVDRKSSEMCPTCDPGR